MAISEKKWCWDKTSLQKGLCSSFQLLQIQSQQGDSKCLVLLGAIRQMSGTELKPGKFSEESEEHRVIFMLLFEALPTPNTSGKLLQERCWLQVPAFKMLYCQRGENLLFLFLFYCFHLSKGLHCS